MERLDGAGLPFRDLSREEMDLYFRQVVGSSWEVRTSTDPDVVKDHTDRLEGISGINPLLKMQVSLITSMDDRMFAHLFEMTFLKPPGK